MKKVLVIGDSCIDIFEYGKCNRICPEAPVPVFIPLEQKRNEGMAFNVHNNIKSLGVLCDIITNKKSPIKKRYVDKASNHMLLRVDRNDNVDELNWKKLQKIPFIEYDAIVISDYDKGFIDREQIRYIADAHPVTFMDSKKRLDEWCCNIKFIKINDKECQENREFLHGSYKHDLIVTKGKDGAVLNYATKFLNTSEHPVRDLTGAGDTFLAGLVANYIKTKDIEEAINFANKCAAWAVTQKGVAVVSYDRLKI
jgi:D-glycero-beta-D-manno-heptose-7-phosphate kinase